MKNAVILIIAILLTTACSRNIDVKPAERAVDEATNNGMDGYMEEVTLKDGTRCVTWKSGYGGGLSCDWKTK